MVLRKLTGVFSIALVIGAATVAMAGVPDLQLTLASHGVAPGTTPVLYNLPNGTGSAFTAAGALPGITVNATITMTVVDGGGIPVVGFSAADMYLVPQGPGNFVACTNGTTADFNTNALGVTTWAAPLRAGGAAEGVTLVYINGSPLTSNAGLVLKHNSADINGDRVANLSDVPDFAGDYFDLVNYWFRSDLQYDGDVNLGDVPRLASGIGAACP